MDFISRQLYSMFVKLILCLFVFKIREYRLLGIDNVWYILLGQLQRLWVSDINGNFV